MNLSPLDIRKHEFNKSFRGYDDDEVNAFLDVVSMEYESLIRENALLNEKVRTANDQLKRYHDIESTLQETLLSAERAREETVKTAKKQAEIIIREAEVKAASIMEEGRRVFAGLQNRINMLMIQKDTYLSRIKALIHSQLDTFENVSFPEENDIRNMEAPQQEKAVRMPASRAVPPQVVKADTEDDRDPVVPGEDTVNL